MTKTVVILDAVEFAVHAHSGQIRHWTNEPYVAHVIRVAKKVAEAGCDPDTVIAALLHDVLEDCPKVTRAEIYEKFGHRVLTMVEDLTDCVHGVGNRKRRKELDRERLSQASDEAQTIKCADTIDNIDSIVDNDPGFGRLFVKEVEKTLAILDRADHGLWIAANNRLQRAMERLAVNMENNDVGC